MKQALQRFLLPLLLLALLSVPAQACVVCGAGFEQTRSAFKLTTLFLTLTPLILIGAAFFWLKARFAQLNAEQIDE